MSENSTLPCDVRQVSFKLVELTDRKLVKSLMRSTMDPTKREVEHYRGDQGLDAGD
jgi:hypothetical protein